MTEKTILRARFHPENAGSYVKPMLSEVSINGVPVHGLRTLQIERDKITLVFDATAMEFIQLNPEAEALVEAHDS